ncbi:hypothetical protein ACHHV8_10150 [Paenibacillus sp. TAB 01]|uniref:hypothetical protein n=1 Tax=Paenibacillus sp. TAB 01 TaxID=3368988 RepID=UPI0037526A92
MILGASIVLGLILLFGIFIIKTAKYSKVADEILDKKGRDALAKTQARKEAKLKAKG